MLRTQGFSKGRDLFGNRNLVSRKCGYDTHNSSTEGKGTREADTSEVQWRLNLFWEAFFFRFPTFRPICRLSRASAQGFSFPVANPKVTPHFVVKMLQ